MDNRKNVFIIYFNVKMRYLVNIIVSSLKICGRTWVHVVYYIEVMYNFDRFAAT